MLQMLTSLILSVSGCGWHGLSIYSCWPGLVTTYMIGWPIGQCFSCRARDNMLPEIPVNTCSLILRLLLMFPYLAFLISILKISKLLQNCWHRVIDITSYEKHFESSLDHTGLTPPLEFSLAFSTMFSQEFHHISFEGQCLSFMIFTSRNLPTTKSEQSWLDENIEAFPGHVKYAIGPLACKNPLLVGFATMLTDMPLKQIYNTCTIMRCMRILQMIHFHGIIITQSLNFFQIRHILTCIRRGFPFLVWWDLVLRASVEIWWFLVPRILV